MNNFLLDRCKNGHQITQSQDKLEMQEKREAMAETMEEGSPGEKNWSKEF